MSEGGNFHLKHPFVVEVLIARFRISPTYRCLLLRKDSGKKIRVYLTSDKVVFGLHLYHKYSEDFGDCC